MTKLLDGFDNATDPTEDLTFDEFDAQLILEYLQWRELKIHGSDPGPPSSANYDEFQFAHQNPRAWKIHPAR